MLAGSRIVLGVSGGIAAYKAVEVCRRLIDAGAHVTPVMTRGAERFLGRTTLSALASAPVQTSLWEGPDPIPHTRLGQAADLVVVAPATARVIGAYAAGLSSDLLVSTLLATRAPVLICPAMHTEMWEHPAVVDNVATLRRRGAHLVGPGVGRLAGGDLGAGRMAEPEEIVAAAEQVLRGDVLDLRGARVVVTAGGTREPIDAVRVIANRSSGKQGYAVAAEAAGRGADVVLISTVERPVPAGVTVRMVESAAEMQAAVTAEQADVIVMAAAVADFRPLHPAERKLKKDAGVPHIELERTPDILAGLGAAKRPGQVIVGFAAETDDLVANAERKLAAKRADLIVANDVGAPGVGFSADTNAVVLLRPGRPPVAIEKQDKRDIARAVVDAIVDIRSPPSQEPPP